MNLTFNEEIFKNCRNKEHYFQYIEEFMLTNLLNTSDFTEDEYIKAVLFRVFVIFLQPGGISETEMKKLLLSHFGIQEYYNRI